MNQEGSLSHRVARGGLWVFALRVVEKGIGLIRLIILARILAPNDFGLFGIALLTVSTLETFSETGFQTALIQRKKDIRDSLDTVWTVSIVRGIILFIIILVSAPYVALFFGNSEASPIIQVIGFAILLNSFLNIGTIYFQKELEFRKQFIFGLVTTSADCTMTVLMALILRNVWALVLGQLARDLSGLVVSYMIHPYRPHFSLNLSKVRELYGFGKWVLGSSILAFLITQGDDAFVGKVLGVTMLGFYQMAYRIANVPSTEITQVISHVTFPAYSKMQDNLPRLREAYLRVLQLTAFLSFPAAGLICALAPEFTDIFLGEKWMPIVPALQVLVLWGLMRSIGTATGQVFVSIGKPGIVTKLQFVALVLLGILIYPLSSKWGIFGTSLAVVLATLVSNVFAFYMAIRTLKCGMHHVFKMIWVPFINTTLLLSILLLMKTAYGVHLGIGGLFLSVVLFLICLFGLTLLFDQLFKYHFVNNVRMSINALRG